MKKFSLIDLFSGAGLLSEGFRSAGFFPVLAVDQDRDAVASYCENVAKVAVVGSVLDRISIPKCDVLIAGPPCQGFSTLGKRDPHDERNSLSMAIVHWAESSRAKIVVVENVPPFVGSPHWKQLTARLRKIGYAIDCWTLDAHDYGVAQLRKRSFTIASKVGLPHQPKPLSYKPVVSEAFVGLAKRRTDPMHNPPPLSEVQARRIKMIPRGGDKRDIMRLAPAECPPSWFRIANEATDAWGRMLSDEPANTLRCGFQNPSKGRYIHPTENRVITLREGARLQGIPDFWILKGDRYPAARQIGNGVPVPLAKAVAHAVRASLN